MKICVIIPVHNEAQTIENIVTCIRQKNLDVFVIDDGSSDNSGKLAQEKGAYVIKNPIKRGKGFSLKVLFEKILSLEYDGVITMDGDGQHDVSDIDNFIDFVKKNKICVLTGNRMKNHKGMPLIRYFTNRIMSFLISFAARQDIPDTQCGYRFIHCDILREICFECNNFEIDTEILMKASKKGFKIFSVPIKTIYKNEKSKINPFKDSIRFFKYFSRELFSSSNN